MVSKKRKGHQITIPDQPTISRIREVLERCEYATKTLEILKEESREGAVHGLKATEDRTPAGILIQLFLQGKMVAIDDLKQALEGMDVNDWAAIGLIKCKKARVTPQVRLTPYDGLLVASDKNWAQDAASQPDAVMGITGSSTWLSRLMLHRRSHLTLDLGTGTGIQAMLAARHSDKVIAVDINPRALAFARFNAQLNGISNIEFIEDDLFAPIKGQNFDLILCNPSFTISPDFHCLYRDNPLEGDEFVRRILCQIPAHLREGGYAQIVCHWEQHAEQRWEMRIADWLRQSGCDAWVMRGSSTEPSKYARKWLKGYDPANIERLSEEWISYFKTKNIVSIGAGIITLRRSSERRNWLLADEVQPKILENAGEHIQRGFQLQDFLQARQENAALLGERFQVTPHMLLEQRHQPAPNGWRPLNAQLTLTRGFAYSIQIDPSLVELVTRCTGKQTLGDLLRAMAVRLHKDNGELINHYMDTIKRLIALGFLWPDQYCVAQPGVTAVNIRPNRNDGKKPQRSGRGNPGNDSAVNREAEIPEPRTANLSGQRAVPQIDSSLLNHRRAG